MIDGEEFDVIWIGKNNVGRRGSNLWACTPLHPHCRCSWTRYYPEMRALLGLGKSMSHKYIKREGSSGHYVYTYAEEHSPGATRVAEITSYSDFSDWWEKKYGERVRNMYSTEEGKRFLEDVSAYSGNRFNKIRDFLLGKEVEPYSGMNHEQMASLLSGQISSIDKYIKDFSLADPVHVWRGANGKAFSSLQVGDEFSHLNFTSWSADPTFGLDWAMASSDPVVIESVVGGDFCSAAPALNRQEVDGVMGMGANAREREILVGRNSKMRVMSREVRTVKDIDGKDVNVVFLKVGHDDLRA